MKKTIILCVIALAAACLPCGCSSMREATVRITEAQLQERISKKFPITKTQQLQSACTLADIVSVQQLYNLLQRDAAKEVLPVCRQNGLGFIAYSPLAQGVLAGEMDARSRPGRQDVRRRNPLYRSPEHFEEAVSYAGSLPHPGAIAALRFLLEQPEVTSVLVGMTQRRHVELNIQALACRQALSTVKPFS